MVAGSRCSPVTLDALAAIDPEAWYHGQLLETILDEAAQKSAAAPYELGRAVYFMLPTQLRQLGVTTPESFFAALPALWLQVTRGDSGWFRTEQLLPGVARITMAQPYNCHFEEGALVGFLDGLGCEQVRSRHLDCMRNGAPCCTLEVAWGAPEKVS